MIFNKVKEQPSLLLHVCCAPCLTSVFERLKDKFNLVAFFYNPNIYPKEEYQKRLAETKRLAKLINLDLILPKEYDNKKWQEAIRGLEKEKEGGKRCLKCFKIRLAETAQRARQDNFDYFTSTLSVSPHKNAEEINKIGRTLAREYGLKFYEADFKKKDGFKRSVQLSKKFNLYRQTYCGCIYSLKNNKQKDA